MKTRRLNHIFLLLFLSFTTIVNTRGQIRLAAYAGIHSANVIESNNIPGWDTAVKKYYSARTGFHLGFLAEIPLGNKGFFLQPGIGYSSKGRQYSKFNDSAAAFLTDTIYSESALKLSYVELPFYLTYKLPLSSNHKNNFFISAGPYFAFFFNGTMSRQNRINSTNQFNQENDDLAVGNAVDKYKTFDLGINAKAGFEFGSVMISGYYSRGLTNFYTAPYDGQFNHELIGATLGIWLNKASAPAPKMSIDSDSDGIPDEQDSCPSIPGSAKWNGCPVPDTDHDGVNDDEDSCKSIAGVAKYHGCPIPDTDGDGINDEQDSCKSIPGIAKYHGCPIPDRDGDGINDEEDHCPDQAGTAENHGCPALKKEVIEKIEYKGNNVTFKTSSSQLTKTSYAPLNDVAVMLKAHPEWHLTIEGFTDASGSQEYNLALSQQRADVVKNYLVKRGISSGQITAIGYGKARAIGDNGTSVGKAKNRRVEFKLESGR